MNRKITKDVQSYFQHFPSLLIIRARQIGKSTLRISLGVENYVALDEVERGNLIQRINLKFSVEPAESTKLKKDGSHWETRGQTNYVWWYTLLYLL